MKCCDQCFIFTAPSPPHSLNANTTNDSISLSWHSPVPPNGVIRLYRVSYYPQQDPWHPMMITTESQHIVISGLRPWFNYSLKVAAFTVKMGPFSGEYLARTRDNSK